MDPRPDLTLYDSRGRLAALVEVKTRLGTSPEWAALFRRNILAHGGFPEAEFFLMVTPDRIYLWKGAGSDPLPVPPDAELPAGPFFGPYFARVNVPAEGISRDAFESIVALWLSELGRDPRRLPGAGVDGLETSGFVASVRGGRIEHGAAAA